ncbi:creatininase family protein [Rhodobacteraceae bacterium CCMM004]|nr:creatininase family protein [Rhodobacteraceae bacterium CCMM004]
MKWEDLSTVEIDAVDRSVPVILNIAAIEQHGPHLPLNTDAVIGALFLNRLDAADPQAQLILPQVKVCCSDHHMDFPGTLSVRHVVLHDYVLGILGSAASAGFTKFLILNSHGGNQGIGQIVTERFGFENPTCDIALVTWWSLVRADLRDLSDSGAFGTGHACEFETSLIMFAQGDRAMPDIPPGEHHVRSHAWADGSMLHPPRGHLYRSMKAMSGGSGVVGQPDAATADKGARICDLVVAALAQVVADLRGG